VAVKHTRCSKPSGDMARILGFPQAGEGGGMG
jgi:hypothetical protein